MRRYGAFRANLIGCLQKAAVVFSFGRVSGKDDKRAVALSFDEEESSQIKRGLMEFVKPAF